MVNVVYDFKSRVMNCPVYFDELTRDAPVYIAYDEAVILSFYNSHKRRCLLPENFILLHVYSAL